MDEIRFDDIAALEAAVSDEFGEFGPPTEVTQEMIHGFAELTGDRQWIHVDVERAKRESPFGGPIAHGFLTLSMAVALTHQVMAVEGLTMAVNYGLNKVRFPAPVRVGSRLRARAVIAAVDDVPGGVQVEVDLTFEVEGGDKPVCVAQTVSRYYF